MCNTASCRECGGSRQRNLVVAVFSGGEPAGVLFGDGCRHLIDQLSQGESPPGDDLLEREPGDAVRQADGAERKRHRQEGRTRRSSHSGPDPNPEPHTATPDDAAEQGSDELVVRPSRLEMST